MRRILTILAVLMLATQAHAVSATGGTVTNYTDAGGTNWVRHVFLTNGTLTITEGGDVEFLIVGGGGSGGSEDPWSTGGGGAGGLVANVPGAGNPLAVTSGVYSVVVGNGGLIQNRGVGYSGSNSAVFGITALGGGGGGTRTSNGASGGSGGGGGADSSNVRTGGAATQAGGTGYSGYGNAGGDGNPSSTGTARNGGGGGGAGAAGEAGDASSGGSGGAGKDMSSYFGTDYGASGWFAGGGGGFIKNAIGGAGGQGGGGRGGSSYEGTEAEGDPGIANTGGGSGGSYYYQSHVGGSGIVIVRYVAGETAATPAYLFAPNKIFRKNLAMKNQESQL